MSFKDTTLWYKDAIIYQLHVRSFADSDSDGVGDFQGLTEKLDYLQDLGVTAIWLLPFYPSPLRDDGYDIADYTNIHPMYGNLRDFRAFLEAAHERDLRVITELVVNHTSDQHAWFQRARRASPESSSRHFYVWSDSPDLYQDTRIIFKDFEVSNWSWDPVARAYYWHRFYSHQPDLNFDNPDVQQEVFNASSFWLDMGVDGLRLDAVPYLFEREGTNCENLPETHGFLQQFRQHVDNNFQDRMLLAEANQWPEDAVAYFGTGNECHMAFHFPLMPRMFIAIRMQDRFPIVETLHHTPSIPDTCQWALFLRNHDELTLEMVTAEERSFMYRTYARNPRARINLGIRRRLAPLLGNDRRQIELLNGLLFSLPGTPVIYYGDEIGMGDNIYLGDRDGVRTPMQWSHDRNAGFSRANPQRIFLPVIIDPEYHYEAVNVEAQQANPYSLLRWMKLLIATRKRYHAFSRGTLEFLYPNNRKVLAFIRRYGDECILVIANLADSIQCAELNLAAFQNMTPVELFNETVFPPIGELPYFLTIGPHAFYWFKLELQPVRSALQSSPPAEDAMPTLTVADDWRSMFTRAKVRAALAEILPRYLKHQRWFSGKNRDIRSAEIHEAVPIPYEAPEGYQTLVQVEYSEGDSEFYAIPFTFAQGAEANHIQAACPQVIAAHVQIEQTGETGILYDALRSTAFAGRLLECMTQYRAFRGIAGEVVSFPTRPLAQWPRTPADPGLEPQIRVSDQSNTTIVYDNQFVFKAFRRIESGINPDLEIGRFLSERVSPAHAPVVLGAFEYQQKNHDPTTLAVLRNFLPNQGTAREYTLAASGEYLERVLVHHTSGQMLPLPDKHILGLAHDDIPGTVRGLIGNYLDAAALLGQRTAELHLTLAQESDDPGFVPEPFSDFFQRPFYHSIVGLMDRDFQTLRRQVDYLPEDVQEDTHKVIALEPVIRSCFQPFRARKITAMRIRCHGNYHLGQVLYTDGDFVILDFEGESSRSLDERRAKDSPLRDIAHMLRSLHYTAYEALFLQEGRGMIRTVDRTARMAWVYFWYNWVSAVFMRGYLDGINQSPVILQTREELRVLLDAYVLERAFHELSYELQHRPDWVKIPLRGILQLLEHPSQKT